MKLKGHSPVDLIINNRKLIEKIYIVLIIFSLICVPMVGINYDLTKYLPDSSPSAQALDIMEDEFTYPGMGRVMLEDVTLYEAKNIKDRIADVDGVDMVMWCDMATNIYGSSEFINYDNIDDYYKDNTAYMDVIFTDKDSSNQTHKAVHEIENIVGDKGLVAGSAVSDTNLGPTINKEVARVMALAVVIIYIILTITTTSWFEPVLFLSVLGIAILINMGTNIIFGEISFLSNAVGAVLQTGLLNGLLHLPAARLHAGARNRCRTRTGDGERLANRLFVHRRFRHDDHRRLCRHGADELRHRPGYGLRTGKGHRAQSADCAAAHAGAHPAFAEHHCQDAAPSVYPQTGPRHR